jgi:hypothetical protein
LKKLNLFLFATVFAVLSIAMVAASFTNALAGDSTLDESNVTSDLSEESTGQCGNCLNENCSDDRDCLNGDSCIDDCVPGNCHGADKSLGCSGYGKHGGC